MAPNPLLVVLLLVFLFEFLPPLLLPPPPSLGLLLSDDPPLFVNFFSQVGEGLVKESYSDWLVFSWIESHSPLPPYPFTGGVPDYGGWTSSSCRADCFRTMKFKPFPVEPAGPQVMLIRSVDRCIPEDFWSGEERDCVIGEGLKNPKPPRIQVHPQIKGKSVVDAELRKFLVNSVCRFSIFHPDAIKAINDPSRESFENYLISLPRTHRPKGFLHIKEGERNAAFGSIFFSTIIGQILLAERFCLIPWIALSAKKTKVYAENGQDYNPWIHFFQPVPASLNERADAADVQALLEKTGYMGEHRLLYSLSYTTVRYVHFFAPFTPRPYYYSTIEDVRVPKLGSVLPSDRTEKDKEAKKIWRTKSRDKELLEKFKAFTKGPRNTESYDEDFFWRNRYLSSVVVDSFYSIHDELVARFEEEWDRSLRGAVVLGIHMRGTDKLISPGRKVVGVHEYEEYLTSFVAKMEKNRVDYKVFVATDSSSFLRQISSDVKGPWRSLAEQQKIVILSNEFRRSDDKPVFGDGNGKKKITEGLLALQDIYFLSKCHYLLHTASALPESAIYINPELHGRSVHLQYEHNRQKPPWIDLPDV